MGLSSSQARYIALTGNEALSAPQTYSAEKIAQKNVQNQEKEVNTTKNTEYPTIEDEATISQDALNLLNNEKA